MTVATSFTHELNVGQIVQRAYNLAGLASPEANMQGTQWVARQSVAKDFLQVILDQIQTEGVFERGVSFVNVTLVAGTFIYNFPDNIIDVIGNGAYIDPTQTDITQASNETPVIEQDREFWQALSAKSAQSRPTIYTCDRETTPVSVRIWPVPSSTEAGGTIRFQARRLYADVANSTVTLDVQRYWAQYLIWELAHHLAISANKLQHGAYLAGKAAELLTKAKGESNQSTASSFVVCHGTGWN